MEHVPAEGRGLRQRPRLRSRDAIRSLQAAGLEIGVRDVTPEAHNGVRPKKSATSGEIHRTQLQALPPRGQQLFLKGERCLTEKCAIERRSYPPGARPRPDQAVAVPAPAAREAEGAPVLRPARAQFRNYYEKAARGSGVSGENLLRLLETRLDNVIYRLGFAASRSQARQLVRHGHFQVNGRRVNIPSFQVKPNDIVMLKTGSPAEQVVRDATDLTASVSAMAPGRPTASPARSSSSLTAEDIDTPVQESLIVELYSK